MIGIITAMREELAPLLKRAAIARVVDRRYHVGTLSGAEVVFVAGGDGLQNAERAASELLAKFKLTLLVGAGIAGAVDPSLKRGDVVIGTPSPIFPEVRQVRIRSLDRIASSKREIADADVVDTETEGWMRAAAAAGVTFASVRVIYDAADDEIPTFVASDGPIDRGAIVRHALTHPRAIPVLLGMRKRVRECSETLADFIARSLASTDARLHQLLVDTSRTFALCIPPLEDAPRRQLTIAYLLFRIADTFEDASHWPVADRLAALDQFCALLLNPSEADARRVTASWHERGPSPHAGYMRLISDVPIVLAAFDALPASARDVIREHVVRSAEGMARYVAMTEHGSLRLADMGQLHDYCYRVAGIVGEMCTELFLINAPQLQGVAAFLRARAAAFGEGLQLVNILKDSDSDRAEGRSYIPAGVDRRELLALARQALASAVEYTDCLRSAGAPRGIITFNALPIAFAQATLDRLETTRATKISRAEVFRIMRQVPGTR